jgi:primosomal protein N' (replication factor Y)
MGTEKVEQEIIQRFPEARVMRWDASSAGKKGAHDLILSHFSRHQADILVGTQMLSKGLDLPLVTLVGVVLADVGLGFPDYRASERTFQLLSQVAGRAGRSPLGGNVIFQTFQPDHHAIRLAAAHDIEGFFSREIENRRSLGFPPFSRLVRVEVRHKRLDGAEQAAAVVAAQLQYWIREGSFRATRIIGPSPCFFAREAGCYRWQVILAGPDPAAILRGRRLESALDAALRIEVNPPDLL